MTLTGKDKSELSNILTEVFTNSDELNMFVNEVFDTKLNKIVSNEKNFATQCYTLVNCSLSRGYIEKFLKKLQVQRPNNEKLKAFIDRVDNGIMQTDSEAQSRDGNVININGNGNTVLQGFKSNGNVSINSHNNEQKPKSDTTKKNILIIKSLPKNANPISADNEIKAITDAYKTGKYKDNFAEPIIKLAVNKDELMKLLDTHEPDYLHFCIHTSKENGLIFTDNDGDKVYISKDEFEDIIKHYSNKKRLKVILVNSCNSEIYAENVKKYCDYAIGMQDYIPAELAVVFTKGFYESFFENNDKIEYAFDAGILALKHDDSIELPESYTIQKHEIPKLIK